MQYDSAIQGSGRAPCAVARWKLGFQLTGGRRKGLGLLP